MCRSTSAAARVLGLAGLVGAGRTDVARMIFGAAAPDRGEVRLDGTRLELRSPSPGDQERHLPVAGGPQGVTALVAEPERAGQLRAPPIWTVSGGLAGVVDRRREGRAFGRWREQLDIRLVRAGQRVATLSGGNQQKVVIARWLERGATVVLCDEPTRGIDVGARYEIYE